VEILTVSFVPMVHISILTSMSVSPDKVPVNQVPHTHWTIIPCCDEKGWIWCEAASSHSPSTDLDKCVDPNSRLRITTNNSTVSWNPKAHHSKNKKSTLNPTLCQLYPIKTIKTCKERNDLLMLPIHYTTSVMCSSGQFQSISYQELYDDSEFSILMLIFGI
jgi:hypothetical protein